MCGGSLADYIKSQMRGGLSPRVRGKRFAGHRLRGDPGSIPACAGEACPGSPHSKASAVYPRVCGGSAGAIAPPDVGRGLSPRVRGKLLYLNYDILYKGSIPACAGEAHGQPNHPGSGRVYPRVCGGSTARAHRNRHGEGLSPRVRGKLYLAARPRCRCGSIPACAGEASPVSLPASAQTVYPRVCGGSSWKGMLDKERNGLSPRVRGKLP